MYGTTVVHVCNIYFVFMLMRRMTVGIGYYGTLMIVGVIKKGDTDHGRETA